MPLPDSGEGPAVRAQYSVDSYPIGMTTPTPSSSPDPTVPAGTIHQISVSRGGVPKLPVGEATVGEGGVVGDRQRNRRVHGGPMRAVCLYSLEVIERLQGEGHPIVPGSAGENITVRGLDWAAVVPGVWLRLGDALLLQVTAYTAPCQNIAGSFADGNFGRIAVGRAPGQARVYARVLRPGVIRAGDAVRLLAAEGE